MVCTTVAVAASKPTISGLVVTDKGGGNVSVEWTQDIPGNIVIKLDGTTLKTLNIGIAGAEQVMLNNVPAGTHSVCVEAA